MACRRLPSQVATVAWIPRPHPSTGSAWVEVSACDAAALPACGVWGHAQLLIRMSEDDEGTNARAKAAGKDGELREVVEALRAESCTSAAPCLGADPAGNRDAAR